MTKSFAIVAVAVLLFATLLTATAVAQTSWRIFENDVMVMGRLMTLGGQSGPALVAETQVVGVLTGNIPNCGYGGTIPISSTANTGVTVTLPTLAGVNCTLVNVGAFTITVTDTGEIHLAGNAVLTPDDTLCLGSVSQSAWYQTCKNAN